jgi:hypothetical protein
MALIFVVLIAVIGFELKEGMTPTKITFPLVGGSVELKPRDDVIKLRVTVLGPDSVPVEDSKVWLSIGGEAKKVTGGWEFDIPFNKLVPLNI